MILVPDDLVEGIFVVVVDSVIESTEFAPNSIDNLRAYAAWQRAETLRGMPLEVVAVRLPFVVVNPLITPRSALAKVFRPASDSSPFPIDVREFQLRRVDEEYVRGFYPKEQSNVSD